MKKKLLFLFCFASLLIPIPGYAQQGKTAVSPPLISYQGLLTSSETGKPLSGSHAITVSLYADEQGNTRIWQGSYTTELIEGVFQLHLGSGNYPLPDMATLNRALWLGVQVDNNKQMQPLTRLTSSFRALSVEDGSITKEKIATDYVAAISVGGEKVTGQGTTLNLVPGKGLKLDYDKFSHSLILSQDPAYSNISNDDKQTANGSVWWDETGNTGTNPANHFVGTLGFTPLEIRVNGSAGQSPSTGDGRVMRYEPQTNSPNLIGGHNSNTANPGGIVLPATPPEGIIIAGGGVQGNRNEAWDNFGFVGGGAGNKTGLIGTTTPSNGFQTIGGGENNSASAAHSFVGGGSGNNASGSLATIGGGSANSNGGTFSTLGGGELNSIAAFTPAVPPTPPIPGADHGFLGGGERNIITDNHGTLGGGRVNAVGNDRSLVGAFILTPPVITSVPSIFPPATASRTDAAFATVGGGFSNTAAGTESGVLAGADNVAFLTRGTVLGGFQNFNFGSASTIGGGEENQIEMFAPLNINRGVGFPSTPNGLPYPSNSSQHSVISGGVWNIIFSGDNAAIGGGRMNSIGLTQVPIPLPPQTIFPSTDATIAGGNNNTIVGTGSSIGGGNSNGIIGSNSAIPGGRNLIVGANSFGFNGDPTAQITNISGTQPNVALFNEVDIWLGNVNGIPRQLRFYANNIPTDLTLTVPFFTSFRAGAQTQTINYVLPLAPPLSNGEVLSSTTGGNMSWIPVVTSVGLDLPTSVFTVSNSPVTTTGTLTATFNNQSANTFFAGPSGGASATPSFRALEAADIANALAVSAWTLNGNSITSAWNGTSGNFIGTTNSQPLALVATDFRFFNASTERVRISADGDVQLLNASAQLQLQGTGSGVTTFEAGAQGSTDIHYTLPDALPTVDNQVLRSTTDGGMSWGSAVTIGGSGGTGGRIPFWEGSGASSSLADNENLQWDDANNNLIVGNGDGPHASVDINGALAFKPDDGMAVTFEDSGEETKSLPTVTISSTDFLVNRTLFYVHSNSTTALDKELTIPKGRIDGQIIMIACDNQLSGGSFTNHSFHIKLGSGSNVIGRPRRTAPTNILKFNHHDIATFIWNAHAAGTSGSNTGRWIMVSFANNKVP